MWCLGLNPSVKFHALHGSVVSASETKSEEHGLKENSHTVKIDPLTRKFQGMALAQLVASETHQAEREILEQPSDGKKMPMSRVSSDAILDKL
jgi:hypothetical protein